MRCMFLFKELDKSSSRSTAEQARTMGKSNRTSEGDQSTNVKRMNDRRRSAMAAKKERTMEMNDAAKVGDAGDFSWKS